MFQSDPVPPNLYHLDEDERVVYVGSFSKILGPGVRQGYFMAPEALQQRIMANKMDGETNALASMIVAEYFGEHLWDHIAEVNRVMKARKDAVVESLEGPTSARWAMRSGGRIRPVACSCGVRIPSATDTRKAHQLAASRGVYYTPGQGFSALGEGHSLLAHRLRFSKIEDIRDGILILAECNPRSSGQGNGGLETPASYINRIVLVILDIALNHHPEWKSPDFCPGLFLM